MAAREAEQKERRIMEVERANFDEKDAEEIVVSGVSVICVNRWAKKISKTLQTSLEVCQVGDVKILKVELRGT